MEKTCVACGKACFVKPSHALISTYCSRQCMSVAYKDRLQGANNPHWKGGSVTKECPRCGVTFHVPHVLADKRKYCSYSCSERSRVRHSKPKEAKSGLPPKPRKPRVRTRTYECRSCGGQISRHRRFCEVCTPRGHRRILVPCRACGKEFLTWAGRPR